ncbi:transglycosylase domain-containing protein [Haliangium sp.]|uniref:transglycosylase domain-containing protein n=1 Tax=Haliangium sp. TaxID=2663208 RepID=UPI003D13A97D
MSTPALTASTTPPRRRLRRLRAALRRLVLASLALIGLLSVTVFVAVFCVTYPVELLDVDRGGPLVITDRHGAVLRVVPGPDHRPGRERWIGLDDIPAPVLLMVVQSEDQNFYHHRGVDPEGVARAALLNLAERRLGYGGSTITMQLVRMLHNRGEPRTLANKIEESIRALRLERAVDKRTILEQYMNRAYYGNGAYGIEAAARRYFDKPAVGLSLGEATLLAVLPRAPTGYDPTRHLDRAQRRRDYVLDLLVDKGLMDAEIAARAKREPVTPGLHAPPFQAPHFTDWVLSQLPADVRARGGAVRTTLDWTLQQPLEERVEAHVAGLAHKNLGQAGALILDTASGEILAMVGSRDYHDRKSDGQINITTWRRHPGSALKPFIYALAIEAGDHPASIAYDLYDGPEDYNVVNRDQPERGPVRYREALAGSYNLAAVDVLERVGVPRLMSLLRRAGVGPLDGDPDDYGLRLALGAAKVRLLDLAGAYSAFVRGGLVRRPTGLISTVSDDGQRWRPPHRPDTRILSPAAAWLTMHMLSDADARHYTFGPELPFDLPFPVAAKTGTARGFADTVAVAVTTEYTVAAWAGNFDGQPTQGLTAMTGAAPLVRAGLLLASGGRRLGLPAAPDDIERGEVCPLSGMRASDACPHRKQEVFRRGHGPRERCDWHLDPAQGGQVRYPARARDWAERTGARGGR